MKIYKAALGTLTVGALALTVGGSAMAGSLTPIASVTTGTTANTNFTMNSGGDTLTVTYSDATFASKIGLGTTPNNTIVNLSATGGTTSLLGGGVFEETFTGGTFSDYSGGVKLLAGTFSGGTILGTVGAVTGGLDITGVTYDADSVDLGSYSPTNGAISLTYNAINPSGYSLTDGGKLNSFTATDSGTYSAVTAVPEPASIAPFVLGGLGLMGLAARTRKAQRKAVTTAN